MATTGTIQQAIRTGYRIQIVWTVDSQSVANNTSTVTAKVQLVSTGSAYTISSTASKSGSLTINGTAYTFTFSAALSANETKTLFTKTVTVAHNADGTKTCSFSATCGINVTLTGTYYGSVTATGSGVFNTIARASTISSVTSSVSVTGSNAVTVNITRASSSFTHTVVFSFGSYSNTVTGVGTSTSYTIPQTWLNAIPDATIGTAKVTVTTYSGSTKIGSAVSANFTLTVPTTVVPSISAVSISEAVSGLAAQFGGYVQNKSKLAVAITAAGSLSSTIKAYKTTIQGANYTAASFTSGFLTQSGTSTVTITVTDSRGRTASTTRSITVTAYAAPTITSFQCFRSLSNGSENYEGTYLNAAVNFNISTVGNKNTKSYSIEYKLKSATTWTALTSGSVYALNSNIISATGFMSTDNSYDIRLSVTDYFTTVRSTIEIPTAFTLLDFNASGKGLAFGKVSEQANGMEINMPIWDRFGTTVGNGLAYYQSSGNDPNTTAEELILTNTNTPVSGAYFFIRTMFYSAKTSTASRTQLAIPYGSTSSGVIGGHKRSNFRRHYVSGIGWTEWMEEPVVVERKTSGIWDCTVYSDGNVELVGHIPVSGATVSTALGGWYRTELMITYQQYPYPYTFSKIPVVEMMFQTTNSNGAMIWTISSSEDLAKTYLPQFYLIRPTTASGVAGVVNIFVRGKL